MGFPPRLSMVRYWSIDILRFYFRDGELAESHTFAIPTRQPDKTVRLHSSNFSGLPYRPRYAKSLSCSGLISFSPRPTLCTRPLCAQQKIVEGDSRAFLRGSSYRRADVVVFSFSFSILN